MGSVDSHLEPDERVVFRTRLHPVTFVGAAGFAVFSLGVAGLIILRNELAPETVRTLLLVAVGLAVCGFVGPLLRWRASQFTVTSRRIVLQMGLFVAHAVEFPHGVDTLEVEQTLGGRLLGYGTVRLGEFVIPRVAQAPALRAAAREATPASARARAR